MSAKEFIVVAGGMGGLFTLVIYLLQTRIFHAQLAFQIMAQMHERYAQLHEDLQSLPKAFDALTPQHLRKIGVYINMCAEEYYWKRRRIIQKDVWLVWDVAMAYYFRDTVIGEAWKKIYRNDTYYPGFREYINGICARKGN